MTTQFNCLREPLCRTDDVDRLVETGVIEHPRMANYLHRVPLPPARYMFTYQQRQEQRIFFRRLIPRKNDVSPYIPLDMHQYRMIIICK
jgi:hypothetical protein